MLKKTRGFFSLVLFILLLAACSDKTEMEKIKEIGNDTHRKAKAIAREAEEKTCETIKGKMECSFEKVEHAVEAGADAVEDAMD